MGLLPVYLNFMNISRMLKLRHLPAVAFGGFCIFSFNYRFSANAQTSLQGSDANNQEIINSIFKRSANPAPARNHFNKTAAFSKKEAFPRKKAHPTPRAQGWNKQSDFATFGRSSLNSARKAKLPGSRSSFANRSAILNQSDFPVPQPNNIKFEPAAGFSRKMEPRKYHGRLPTEAVQALEQIRQRELSIEEVRALLNKHQRPD